MVYLHWTQYLAALLTPIVAILAVYIGYRQWRTAQNKLKLDLFDRRIKNYDATHRLIKAALSGKPPEELQNEFSQAIYGVKWLFGSEVESYLHDVLWSNICDLLAIEQEINDLRLGPEKKEKINQGAQIKKSLSNQQKIIDEKFRLYLALYH